MLPLSMPEMIVVMFLAVLLFGKRLPDVGRSLGKGFVEFKKGLRIEDEFHSITSVPERFEEPRSPDIVETPVPKFEPPTVAPIPTAGYEPQITRD